MAIVAITSCDAKNSQQYVEVMESAGAQVRLLMPDTHGNKLTDEVMDGVAGLMLTGGPDVDPALYQQEPDPEAGLNLNRALDDLELRVLARALEMDMPVLAIGRGMQLLNVAFGGRLIQDLPNHRATLVNGQQESADHQIYVAPGAKTAAIIGMAGIFKVNSRHHQGLTEAQRAPRLMTTGYSVEDGLVEGLESPEHSWVIGLQCHPERQEEVPKLFSNLFAGLHERAEAFEPVGRA
jgi:putative glutamine amidotransferase